MGHLLICIKWNFSLSQQMVSVRHMLSHYLSRSVVFILTFPWCAVFCVSAWVTWCHVHGLFLCECVRVRVCVSITIMLQRARQGERLPMGCRQTKARRLWWKFWAFRAGGCLIRRSIFMAFRGGCSVSILCVCVFALWHSSCSYMSLCVWQELYELVYLCFWVLLFADVCLYLNMCNTSLNTIWLFILLCLFMPVTLCL